MQAGCRVRFSRLPLLSRLSTPVVPCGRARLVVRPPHITAALHPQRPKHSFCHIIVQRFSSHLLHNFCQIHESFARIAESHTGCKVNRQRIPVPPPIRKSCSVTQNNSCRDFFQPRISVDVRLGQVSCQRCVQVQLSSIHQLQHAIRKYRLTQRSPLKDRILGHSLPGCCV